MITIISGTNRPNSETLAVAQLYLKIMKSMTDEEVKLLSLENIPAEVIHFEMYESEGQYSGLTAIQDEFMIPANKFFFIVPEYNGSFPGILKLFLDACSIRQYKPTFKGKKVGLAGVASGRAGNLRGMDHLTSIMHHVGSTVLPFQLPLSRIEKLKNGSDEITDPGTLKSIRDQVKDFLAF